MFESTLIQQGWLTAEMLETLRRKHPEASLEKILIQEKIVTLPHLKKILLEVKQLAGRPFGKYDILCKIAQGAMGVVYKVRHRDLGKIYALKVLKTSEYATEETIQRFIQEAQMTAKLQHPHLVQCVDSGKKGDFYYLVMEYVEGKTLEEKIEAGLPFREGISLLILALEALHYAHQQGVLHRDLKPSNIFITPSQEPKIGDFGLAKDFQKGGEFTQAGEILGTPSYMSPEQASGEISSLDERSDIYSMGVCLYKILTKHCPFEENSVHKLLYRIITEPPQAPSSWNPEIPKDLDILTLKALEKIKEDRYENAQDFAEDLKRFLAGQALSAKEIRSSVRWIRKVGATS
jgi:serine/threonine protein kinase